MKTIILFCGCLLGTVPALMAQSGCANPPVVSINTTATTVCAGDFVTLSAGGANTYVWSHNVESFEPFAPVAAETYQVIGTDAAGCSDTATIFIDVLPVPQVVANASSHSICLGESVALQASGAQSYTWDEPTIMNGQSYTPQSIGSNSYTVVGTGANGCTNTSQVVVLVRATPPAPSLSTTTVTACWRDAVAPIEATADGALMR